MYEIIGKQNELEMINTSDSETRIKSYNIKYLHKSQQIFNVDKLVSEKIGQFIADYISDHSSTSPAYIEHNIPNCMKEVTWLNYA